MRLVSAAKYAALHTRYQRTDKAREDAEKLAAERQTTITRLRTELEQARDTHPANPRPQPPAAPADAELRRQLNLAHHTVRTLAGRLDDLQTSHIADTRELHDLRQGGQS